MMVLDTNVISEMMKPSPSAAVERWLVRHGREDLHTTAMCQAEILAGIAFLPPGRRRHDLQQRAEWIFADAFVGKILPFDAETASHFAGIVADRQRVGQRMDVPDAIIAAVVRRWQGSLVTRNVGDFEGCGIGLHDPWRGSSVPG